MEPLGSGISFCIVTNGKRPAALQEEIASIRRLKVPHHEIIVAGEIPTPLDCDRRLELVEAARSGNLGLMRNRLAEAAKFDTVVTVDDDFLFHDDFYVGLLARRTKFDILSTRIVNPDGTRFWDWAVFGAPTGHHLLSYDETSPYLYVTGGFSIQRRSVILDVLWAEDRAVNQAEDVDYSERAKAKGYKIEFCRDASVTHNDPSYTRVDDFVFRNPIPGTLDNLGGGLAGEGFYPKEGDGSRFVRPRAQIVVPELSLLAPAELVISLEVLPASLYTQFPLSIVLYVNNSLAKKIDISEASQKLQIKVPLDPSRNPVKIDVITTGAVTAQLLGNHRDRRTIGFRLHEVKLHTRSLEGYFQPSPVSDKESLPPAEGVKLIGQELNGTLEGLLSRLLLPVIGEEYDLEKIAIEPVFIDPHLVGSLRTHALYFKQIRNLLGRTVTSGKVIVSLPLHMLPDPGFLPRVWSRHGGFAEREVITFARTEEEVQSHLGGLKRATQIHLWDESQKALFCSAGVKEDSIKLFQPPEVQSGVRKHEHPTLLYVIPSDEELEFVVAFLTHLLQEPELKVEVGFDLPPWRTEARKTVFQGLLDDVLDSDWRGRIKVVETPLLDDLPESITHILSPLSYPKDPRYKWIAKCLGVTLVSAEEPLVSKGGATQSSTINEEVARIWDMLLDSPLDAEPAPLQPTVSAPSFSARSSLRLFVDCRSLHYPEISQRGIGSYTRGFLRALCQEKEDWEITVGFEANEQPSSLEFLEEFSNVSSKRWEEVDFHRFDLAHLTDQMSLLLGYDAPVRLIPKSLPTTLTFYDLIPLRLSGLFFDTWPDRLKEVYMKRLQQLASSQVHILAISESTRSDLLEFAGIEEGRVSTIYGAADLAPCTTIPPLQEVKAKYGIENDFLLVVGALDKQKNFETVLRGYVAAAERYPLHLVVVGSFMDPYKELFKNEISRLGIPGVIFTGFISEEELAALYQGAIAMCFPSLYEGFGVPILEAMVRGCPVITSSAGALPEVAGKAACIVEPYDSVGLARIIEDLARSPSKRRELIEMGYRQAEVFSWRKTIEKASEVWKTLLA